MTIEPNTIYKDLLENFGELNWWPMDERYHKSNSSDPRYEVIVGAILTQNTAWSNVEKALESLKEKNKLDIDSILKIDIKKLQELIRPSGFFNQKAERVKTISEHIKKNYNGNLDKFFKRDIQSLRDELLSLNGIGPETADSIILYAGNLPIFVVDAYTKRLCKRLPLDTELSYEEIQNYFQKNIESHYSKDELAKVYNNLHALIVINAKTNCKKKPNCSNCPLGKYCKKQSLS